MADRANNHASPSNNTTTTSAAAAPPVPKPRKRAPPPKPTPYRKHKENKVQDITTFKSIQPAPVVRSNTPPVPADRKQNKVSLKGEPSSQPKKTTAAPVECGILVVPKRGERPRLNTPIKPPDPDGIIGGGGGREDGLLSISHRPRLNTPAVLPDPSVVRASKLASKKKQNNPSALSRVADVSDDDDDDDDIELGNGYSVVEYKDQNKEKEGDSDDDEDEDEDGAYAVINLGRKESFEKPLLKSPSVSTSTPPPPLPVFFSSSPAPPPPLPARNYDESDVFGCGGGDGVQPVSSSSSPMFLPPSPIPSRDDDYSITSHGKNNAPPRREWGASTSGVGGVSDPMHPCPLSGTSSEGYNVINREISPVPSSSAHNDSRVPLPVEEYSKLAAGSHDPHVTADGYSHLDIPVVAGIEPVLVPEYELIAVDPAPSPTRNQAGPNPRPIARRAPPPPQGVVSGKPNNHHHHQSGVDPVLKSATRSPVSAGARLLPPSPPAPHRGAKPTKLAVSSPLVPVQTSSSPVGATKLVASSPLLPLVPVHTPSSPVGTAVSSPPLPLVPVQPLFSPEGVSSSSSTTTTTTSPPLVPPDTTTSPPLPLVPVLPSPKEASSNSTSSSSSNPSPSPSPHGKTKVSPVPLPKPKKKPPPLAIKEKSTTKDVGKSSEVATPSPDSSLDSGCVVHVSPKVELDIDEMVRSRKSITDTTSVKSYENQEIIDVIHARNMSFEDTTGGSGGGDGDGENLRYENQDVLGDIGLPGSIGTYTAPLSPSEVFTVPQHAVPGALNYCEVDVTSTPPQPPPPPSQPEDGNNVSEFVIASSQVYPDSQGYFDINFSSSSSPIHSKAPQPLARGESARSEIPKPAAPPSSVNVTPEETHVHHNDNNMSAISNPSYMPHPSSANTGHAYSDISVEDIEIEICDHGGGGGGGTPSSPMAVDALDSLVARNRDDESAAHGYYDVDILVENSGHSRSSSHDSHKMENSNSITDGGSSSSSSSNNGCKSLEASGVEDPQAHHHHHHQPNNHKSKLSDVKTLPRRRPPPPPPPSKITSYGDDALSPRKAPLDGVVSSGLCTLSRTSQNAYKNQKSSKPAPSFLSGSKKKSEEIILSSPTRQTLSLPVSSGSGGGAASHTTHTTTSPREGAEVAAGSPGLTKRFMGLLKKRPSKRGKGGRQGSFEENLTKSLDSPPSQPSSSNRKQQAFEERDDFEDYDESGIYSTIPESGGRSQEVKSGAAASAVVGRSVSVDQDVITIKTNAADEAGYELVPSKKKKRTRSSMKESKMHRSSSAEHLYETADFNKGKPNKSTNNSPRVRKRADNKPRGGPERKVLDGPPEPGDLPEGMDDSHLYAHVVSTTTTTTSTTVTEPTPPPMEEINKEVKVKEEVARPDDSDGGGVNREALGLVVTCHGGEGTDEDGKDEAGGVDIEHTSSGDHMYAVVQTTSKKKKKKNTTSVSSNNGECSSSVGQNGDDVTPPLCAPSHDHTHNNNNPPTPVKPPRQKTGPKPVKPVPFSPKGTTPPVTIGKREIPAPLVVPHGNGEAEFKSLPSSPSRGSNPATPSQPPPPPQPDTDVLAKSRMSLSSKPPSFPPPPPPSVSPPPPPPLSPSEEDNAYAVVLTTKKSKPKTKTRNAAPPPPPPPAPAPNKGVHINSASSKPVMGAVSYAPHPYAIIDVSNGTLVSGSESVSVPTKNHSENKNSKSQMRKYRTLPARGTPPPPPPPTSVTQAQDDSGYATVHVGGNAKGQSSESGAPQFLFSSNYASTLIRVGESPGENAEEDSEDEECYSTEWETSSNGEEDEDVEETEEKSVSSTPRSKIFHIAHEILTTERTFVKGLTLLDKDFRQAVRSANNAHEKPVISDENLKQILGNVGSILALNSGFLDELETRMKSWEQKPLIGDILQGRAPYFKIYTEYISRFDTALKTLEEQKKNPLFSNVLHEFESLPKCANIPLAGYMLDVVQRITRYKLLFADYVKHLPENSLDQIPSEKALVIISQVATHVNETIRQMDNFRKVVEVRKKLVGDSSETLITPSRKLLKEGELIKFSRKEKQPRMFFLFNDILIYAAAIPPTNTTYRVIKKIPLEGMKVDLLDDPDVRHAFQIISTCKSFRLEASNEKERLKWFEMFERAIKELNEKSVIKQKSRLSQISVGSDETDAVPLGSFAPPWLPDSSVSMCQLCSFNFTMTRRRHHCRACGMIFCSDCSGYFAPLKYKNSKIGRVCQACFEKLSESGSDSSGSPMKKVRSLPRTKQVSLPSVLREIRARDQSAQISGYLQSSTSKHRWWKKRWFVVYDLVLYEFERHEDVSAKRSVTLPSYQVISPIPNHDDPLVFCLKHAGTGKEYFKTDTEEQLERWVEVLRKAVVGETEDSVQNSSSSSALHTSTSTTHLHSSSSSQQQDSLLPTHLPSSSPGPSPSQLLAPHNEEAGDNEKGGNNEEIEVAVLCNGDSTNNITESSS